MWRRAIESVLKRALVATTVGGLLTACGQSTPPAAPAPVATPTPVPTPTPDPLIPVLLAPVDQMHFSLYPRVMKFEWSAPPRAVSYRLEMLYQVPSGGWYEVQRVEEIYGSCVGTLTATTCTTNNFVGANPGQWRVIAKASNGDEGATPWRTFYHDM